MVAESGIAARVRDVISSTGKSQDAFAEEIGLDPTKLSKSLNGRRRFTSLELARVADVGAVTVDWLLTGDARPGAMAARFASTVGTGAGSAVAEGRKFAEIRENLDFLGVVRERPAAPRTRGLWIEQGQALAEWALARIGLPSALSPAEDFATAIERSFGIDVRVASLEGCCDGLAMRTPKASVMVVATSENPTRQRFTMAHELAHLLWQDDQDALHVDEDVMGGGKGSESEVRANAFAAAVLMPRSLLEERTESGLGSGQFADLVMELKVSPSALAWRLLSCDLIDDERRREFGRMRTIDCAVTADRMKQYTRWVEASSQPRVPEILLEDALGAYMAGKCTLQPVAHLMGAPVEIVRAAVEETLSAEQEATSEFVP